MKFSSVRYRLLENWTQEQSNPGRNTVSLLAQRGLDGIPNPKISNFDLLSVEDTAQQKQSFTWFGYKVLWV